MAGQAGRPRRGRKQTMDEVLALWEAGMPEVAAAVLEQAKGGDVRSQQEILRRVLGKPDDAPAEDDPNAATLRIIIGEPDPPPPSPEDLGPGI